MILTAASLSGQFTRVTGPGTYNVAYNPNNVTITVTYPPGDLNCDGVLNNGDVNPFVQYLSNFAGWQATYPDCPPTIGDINGDGTYGQGSFSDIAPFVALILGNG